MADEEAKQLYREWLDAVENKVEAASLAAMLEEQLAGMGIDVNDPPEWMRL